MNEDLREKTSLKNVFIIGAKSIGQYGGYETFLDKLTEVHQNEKDIQYYILTKANGDGAMDETKLSEVSNILKDESGKVKSFKYHNAKVVKLEVPQIGAAQAIAYDVKAFKWCLKYISEQNINNAIIYVLACRIGPFFGNLVKKAHKLEAKVYVNPDGHEWKRAKWSAPVRKYWKWSEKKMVGLVDLVICDSVNIEKYIRSEYGLSNTTYIAYGADVEKSTLSDNNPKFTSWLEEKGLKPGEYYLVVGRFVPENNYETMIREFMKSHSQKDFAIITNMNDKLRAYLEETLRFSSDPRIKFVGTVYDQQLLKKIRENAYGYFHGHEVGGTNPSLLEALGSTELNLLLDVGFNREVGAEAAQYWKKDDGSLAGLIDKADGMQAEERAQYGVAAKARIKSTYSWEFIGSEYKRVWLG